jgi:DMSO/TMAO reductase YedYZ molybdopterin-dependent catalytic subunit
VARGMTELVRDPALRVVSPSPFNAETPLDLQDGLITPVERHYVRNHFAVPDHPGIVSVDGRVARPRDVSVESLRGRPRETLLVTMECAGNGRRFLEPAAPGEQWGLGAVGTAEWTGVRLGTLLEEAGVESEAVEVLFEGADRGTPGALGYEIAFQRSLPVAAAREALLAIEMNGAPLAPDHGAPVRLVVPGRYGMTAVKWLRRATLVDEPFRGFFQADRYVIDGSPLGPIAPRAVIASPSDGARVAVGSPRVVRGYAWSGRGPVTSVEVSTDGGSSWQPASLGPAPSPVAWRAFERSWTPLTAGVVELWARAIDASGEVQPLDQNWNSLGYMNNAARPVSVEVRPR